ncbi:MAG: GAF domain-containing protein [Anaerolineae bacterium]|nr:GAF domain-containing protein [Anaerolineae bacterium]
MANKRGIVYRVLTAHAPVLAHDLTQGDEIFELSDYYPEIQPRSCLGIPIINPVLNDKIAQGAIILWDYEPNTFNNHHIWLLSAIGTQASIALRNAQHFASSQHRAEEMAHLRDLAQRKADEMSFLNKVARTLGSTLNLNKVLTNIMEQVEVMLAVEAGSLLLTDQSTGELVFQIALGDKADEVKPFRVPKGQGIAGQVAQSGQPLIISDAGLDARHFKDLDEKIQFVTRNILCVPLILHGQVIGVLQVLNKKVGDFTQNDSELLSSIASYAAIAIENARLYQSLEEEHTRTIQAERAARNQLARDLHDGPTQLVAAMMMNLDFAAKALKNDRLDMLPNTLTEMEELAKRASHQMRTLLFELRPLVLETQGLGAALEVFLERRQKDIEETQSTKLKLELSAHHPDGDISRQEDNIESTIFAIVQETVNNAIKHAKAGTIVVGLKETPNGIYASVKDDGLGFDLEAVMKNYETRGSLGMINLRERAESVGAEFSIESKMGTGTHIAIYVPKERAEKEKRKKKRTVTGILKLPTYEPPSMNTL